MTKRTKISDLPVFDAAEHLRDDEDIAAYLTVVLEENDASALADALGTIARARGMREIAEAAGIGRESLYKALRAGASPRLDTIARVCSALGLKLTVTAEHATP
jgi:probable addiction module antidote protein